MATSKQRTSARMVPMPSSWSTRLFLALSLAVASLLSADRALACSIREGSAPTWIDGADVIVRARAVDQKGRKHTRDEARAAHGHLGTTVVFEPIEVLKGRAPAAIEFEGEFVEWKDSNDPWLPYTMVRRGGRGGNCYAKNYTAGAEYLLMLKARDGVLTPYWAALGATNEQLTAPRDGWLNWVRSYLELRDASPAATGTMRAYCPDSMDLFPEMRCQFAVGHDRFDIDGHGRLRRLSGRLGPREMRLTFPEHDSIDGLSVSAIDDDLLLVYGLGNVAYGAGEVARLDGRTLAVKWRLPLPGFNVSLATIEGSRMYIATIGAVAAVDLSRGTFIWKHEGLYDRELFSFNAFERPVVGPEEVIFREDTGGERPRRRIRARKDTGEITVEGPDPTILLAFGKAGELELGVSVDELFVKFGLENTRLVDLKNEGMFTPAIEIRLPGSSAAPAMVAQIREWPCSEFSVWAVAVRDPRFRTAEGFGVGSNLGDLQRRWKVVVGRGEGDTYVQDPSGALTFVLDAENPTPRSRVTSVFVVSQPVHVRKTRCAHLGPIGKW